MKCIDKTCICAIDCSNPIKCDDGCGGTCPQPQINTGDVCYQGNWCKKKCGDECEGDSDKCGGTCGPCPDIIAREVNQNSSTCSSPPDDQPKGTVIFGAGYWPNAGMCGTNSSGSVTGYPARCATGEDPIAHKDITYNGIAINKTRDIGELYNNYCYKKCPATHNSYSVEDKALFCKKK
jgi:hypothetical protein